MPQQAHFSGDLLQVAQWSVANSAPIVHPGSTTLDMLSDPSREVRPETVRLISKIRDTYGRTMFTETPSRGMKSM